MSEEEYRVPAYVESEEYRDYRHRHGHGMRVGLTGNPDRPKRTLATRTMLTRTEQSALRKNAKAAGLSIAEHVRQRCCG